VQEQRRHERRPVQFTLAFSGPQGERTVGTCADISVGGMRVRTDHPASFGSKVTIYAVLGSARQPSVLPGTVRWANRGEMGVQFDPLGARETYAITQLLAG
jgi:PilZ domain